MGPKRSGSVTVDPNGTLAWLTEEEDRTQGGSRWGWKRHDAWPLGQCLWAAHGVWDEATGEVLNDAYFQFYQGPAGERTAEFAEDYWLPHYRQYAALIRSTHREAIMFISARLRATPQVHLPRRPPTPRMSLGPLLRRPHPHHKALELVQCRRRRPPPRQIPGVLFAIRVGNKAIRQCIRDQLGYLRQDCLDGLGQYPSLIGEIGIPYDLDNKKSYFGDNKGRGVGDYTAQTAALDASLNACDGKNLLSYTVWTYCPTTPTSGATTGTARTSASGVETMSNRPTRRHPRHASFAQVELGLFVPKRHQADGQSHKPLFQLQVEHKLTRARAGRRRAQCAELAQRPARSLGLLQALPSRNVGTPASIEFDMKSSQFEYVVDVTAAELQHGLPTEIYLPFLHYGAHDVAAAASGDRGNRRKSSGAASDKWARKQERKLRSADSLSSSRSSITDSPSADDASSSSASTVLADSTELSPLPPQPRRSVGNRRGSLGGNVDGARPVPALVHDQRRGHRRRRFQPRRRRLPTLDQNQTLRRSSQTRQVWKRLGYLDLLRHSLVLNRILVAFHSQIIASDTPHQQVKRVTTNREGFPVTAFARQS